MSATPLPVLSSMPQRLPLLPSSAASPAASTEASTSQGSAASPEFADHNQGPSSIAAVHHSAVLIGLSCGLIMAIWFFVAWEIRMNDQGLAALSGIDVTDLLAASIERRRIYFVGAACTTFLIVAFVAALVRRARLQIELVRSLEESTRKANAANIMKTRFLASVSHELRTPLNGILGYAELVHATSSDAQAREFGQIILSSAQQLQRLVDTMLDLAKIESGHLQVECQRVEVSALLEEIKRLHEPRAEARRLQLRIDQKRGCPNEIQSDRQRLLQILSHLVDNAIKFSRGGRVVISARGEDDTIVFNVADRGIGMTASQLQTIFTRFEAANQDFVHAAQGAGLGLPLANQLVGLLRGSISIQSTVGEGTSVSVTLRVAPADDSSSNGFNS